MLHDRRNRRASMGATVAVAVLILATGTACGGGQPTAPDTAPSKTRATGESEAYTYGDDLELDRLWDACDSGEAWACDELFASAPSGSDYEDFGYTCGRRTEGGDDCALGSASEPTSPAELGDGVDYLCEDAMSAIDDVPTGGSDDEDFAIEEFAVSEILRDLALELSEAGASELSDAVAVYAESRAALAVAYDTGGYDTVNAAFSDVELAAAEVARAAAAAGAYSCEQMASY